VACWLPVGMRWTGLLDAVLEVVLAGSFRRAGVVPDRTVRQQSGSNDPRTRHGAPWWTCHPSPATQRSAEDCLDPVALPAISLTKRTRAALESERTDDPLSFHHCVARDQTGLSTVTEGLSQANFRPILADALKAMEDELAPWGPRATDFLSRHSRVEILVSSDGDHLICVNLTPTSITAAGVVLDIAHISRNGKDIPEEVIAHFPGQLIPHSWIAEFSIRHLDSITPATSSRATDRLVSE
jgi:hypothetical protein